MRAAWLLLIGFGFYIPNYAQDSLQVIDSNALKRLEFVQFDKPQVRYDLPNYYIPSLGYFCKKELQLQKQTIIPIKFRLGSQQACDLQEGK